jgi:hypothetical protein
MLEQRLRNIESILTDTVAASDENVGSPEVRTHHERQSGNENELGDDVQNEQQERIFSNPRSRPVSHAATSSTGFSPPPREKPAPKPNSVQISNENPSAKEGREKVTKTDNSPETTFRALSDIMCSLATKDCAEPRSNIFCTELSVFSPGGIRWISETTGDYSLKETISSAISDNNPMDDLKSDLFSGMFQRPIMRQLPPKAETLERLKEWFRNFNTIFPLFSEPTFMTLLDRQYTNHPCTDVGWWASLNITLALSYRVRSMTREATVVHDDDQKSLDYLKNALSVFTELSWCTPTLLSVQALLGMVLFMQGYPNPEPVCSLLAVALRLSHSLGLHCIKASSAILDPLEAEQRRRVFWIAYRFDKDICFRLGRPILQDDDDMTVDLPSEDPADGLGNVPLANGKGKINLFRLTTEFSRIESRIYKQLYARKALELSDEDRLYTIGELDQQIENWKNTIPVDFRPEYDIETTSTALIVHIIALHLSYYNALRAIHRTSVNHRYWTSRSANSDRLDFRPLNPRVFSSQALCVSAARASIHLTNRMPSGNHRYSW